MTIRIAGVTKKFADDVVAVHDLDLSIASGEFFALLGPSGCGKSTTLRLIAGLESPDAGAILLNGQTVADSKRLVPAENRSVGLVFQDYALFPHLTVESNIEFALSNLDKAARRPRVDELVGMVGIKGLERRYPHELSGGQQQRVALARAMANRPSVMLLDEPFSNLDSALRESTRRDVRSVLASQRITTVLVTHDREEAFSLADRVGVMIDGTLAQVGTPEEIYSTPSVEPVARIGGAVTLVPGVGHGDYVDCEIGRLPLLLTRHGDVCVMVRPEAVKLVPNAAGSAHVVAKSFLGPVWQIDVRLPSGLVLPARVESATAHSLSTTCDIAIEGPVVAFPTRDS